MKSQEGFIQVPILIAIIAGALVVGGAGYISVKQYQNYRVEKIEEEKKAQALAEAQKKSLEETQQENVKVEQPKKEIKEMKEEKEDQQVAELCKPLFREPTDKSKDGKINIVFIGFGYQEDSDVPPKEVVPLLANIVVDPLRKNQGLFSVEPFKSSRDKFNFWYVDKLGEMKLKDCGGIAGLCLQDSESLSENCAVPNKFVVNFVNKIGVLNLGGKISTMSAPTGQNILESPQNLIQMAKIFVHEFGGHGIGVLSDEYDFLYPGQQFQGDVHYSIEGKDNYSNCYAGPKHTLEEASQNAQWRNLIGNGCGKDGVIDCSDKDTNYNIEVGVFEGCAGYSFGIFRPTRNSIMRNADIPPPYSFGPWNERLIKDRIMQIIK